MRVNLDGDDDPAIQTENVRVRLEAELAKLRREGLIRGYHLEVRS